MEVTLIQNILSKLDWGHKKCKKMVLLRENIIFIADLFGKILNSITVIIETVLIIVLDLKV